MRSLIVKRSPLLSATFVIMLLSSNYLKAQRPTANITTETTMMTTQAGAPIYLKTHYAIVGSPYFPPEFTNISIVLKSGIIYPFKKARMNLYDNTLVVLEDNGREQLVTGNITKIIFESVLIDQSSKRVVFQKGFPAINGRDSTIYYEVLDSGKLKLIKHYKVSFSDKRSYGDANMTRVFEQEQTFYIVLPGKIIRQIEKGKEDFLSALPDKRSEIEKYIDEKKIKCKKEKDWIDLVSYYNSITQ
jgi:hypothetical protein